MAVAAFRLALECIAISTYLFTGEVAPDKEEDAADEDEDEDAAREGG